MAGVHSQQAHAVASHVNARMRWRRLPIDSARAPSAQGSVGIGSLSRHDFMSIDINSQRSPASSERSAGGYPAASAAAAAGLRAAAVPQLAMEGLHGSPEGVQVPTSASCT